MNIRSIHNPDPSVRFTLKSGFFGGPQRDNRGIVILGDLDPTDLHVPRFVDREAIGDTLTVWRSVW